MALRAIWSGLLLAAMLLSSVDGCNVTALRAHFARWRHSAAGQMASQRGFLKSNHTLERYFNARLRARALRLANPRATFGITPYALLTPLEFLNWVDPDRTFQLNDSSIVDRGFATADWTIVDDANPDEWHIDVVHDGRVVAPPTLPADAPNVSTPVVWQIDHTRCFTTPPRFQGRCGNCWAFASNAAIEGAYCAKFNTTIALSDQYVTTCSDNNGGGCNGGTTVAGMNFTRFGACALADAPFTLGKTGAGAACRPCAKPLALGVSGVGRVAKSVAAFTRTLAKSPIAVSLSAGNPAWQFYVGGVLTSGHNASAPLDHAVTIVGYGVANGVPVWKIRNSWGTKWGEGGYMLLSASTNDTSHGLFHVLAQGFVPLL
ncbi:hypothetical protein SPRG_02814 [Saprolegnia parasitica CBS 223.65]|uniref:Peptidase C1A papain C-terminal domain-containing protein n=1 Tax=Saprolegnia parasitica (strain CBS 223.65) TaxID=695850 RepID=A0A067CSW4_SAPPC|nr:hypothetical protein SPRG_02814 [Saprolegnia parasitica CBS 223.65]KDO32335.1 hypothetical protein SPRG_02814 [Saprolegnia parasitica CBS 223.65]|eukprot:XP_012196791.1 hypothetical protein SPRG_02814 [Saprolegnia parasitica CBS 223.65]